MQNPFQRPPHSPSEMPARDFNKQIHSMKKTGFEERGANRLIINVLLKGVEAAVACRSPQLVSTTNCPAGSNLGIQ